MAYGDRKGNCGKSVTKEVSHQCNLQVLPSLLGLQVPLGIQLRWQLLAKLLRVLCGLRHTVTRQPGKCRQPLLQRLCSKLGPAQGLVMHVNTTRSGKIAPTIPMMTTGLSVLQIFGKVWQVNADAADARAAAGLPVGVNAELTPSPAWPIHTVVVAHPEPLVECHDSWKSAEDHPAIVEELMKAELQAGFIAHVPGGVPELRRQYSRTAVDKLGVVIPSRLVVDSSISNVTSNTIIPNHKMLPRISDVMDSAPVVMAQQQMTQLTLDVSKAHRRILIAPNDKKYALLPCQW